jgi:DNA-binding transcriptional ArsR family regulator
MQKDVFQAIADPQRRTILDLLARQPLPVHGIADHFPISRPAVSKHVKILAQCGLIEIYKRGRERVCEVQPQKLNEVTDWIDQYRQTWEQRFDRLDEILQELQTKEKTA